VHYAALWRCRRAVDGVGRAVCCGVLTVGNMPCAAALHYRGTRTTGGWGGAGGRWVDDDTLFCVSCGIIRDTANYMMAKARYQGVVGDALVWVGLGEGCGNMNRQSSCTIWCAGAGCKRRVELLVKVLVKVLVVMCNGELCGSLVWLVVRLACHFDAVC
jgi:hypothetical protein